MTNQTPVRPADRENVYQVVDGERDYQGKVYPASPHPDLVYHTNLLIKYTDKLAAEVVGGSPAGGPFKRLRQIAAIAVAAMEAHGAQPRENHVPVSAGVTGTLHIVAKSDSVGAPRHAAGQPAAEHTTTQHDVGQPAAEHTTQHKG